MTVTANAQVSTYELIIGLEVHIQLNTKTKIFSSDSAAFNTEPNHNLSAVSLGLPGSLPQLNEKAIEFAVKMGLGTNCEINLENRFDRKNYFYADLPKGYQITQDDLPICVNGFLMINDRRIRINRIHMEEDAGKSIHTDESQYSLIDLNRAGVPLLELVTEPDLRSAEEAALFLTEIRRIARYLEVSDGNMEEGSIRCDANISIRPAGTSAFGNRCEVKNLNSIKNTQRAIEYEFNRQLKMAQAGEEILQQTLNFDANTGVTTPLRSKEMANDYRYMPDPDLLPVILTQEYIEKVRAGLPELPEQAQKRLKADGLTDYDVSVLISDKALVRFYDELNLYHHNKKSIANFIIGPAKSYLNENNCQVESFPLSAETIAGLLSLVDEGKISHTSAYQKAYPEMLKRPGASAEEICAELQLLTKVDVNELDHIVADIIQRNPLKVKEYKNGKKGIVGMFMGEAMKISGGKINPQEANKLIINKLENIE